MSDLYVNLRAALVAVSLVAASVAVPVLTILGTM